MAVQSYYGNEMGFWPFDDVKKAYKAVRHTTGQLVRAPGELVETATKIAKGAGEGVEKTTKTIPVVLFVLAAGVAGYLIFAGRKGTKLIPG